MKKFIFVVTILGVYGSIVAETSPPSRNFIVEANVPKEIHFFEDGSPGDSQIQTHFQGKSCFAYLNAQSCQKHGCFWTGSKCTGF